MSQKSWNIQDTSPEIVLDSVLPSPKGKRKNYKLIRIRAWEEAEYLQIVLY